MDRYKPIILIVLLTATACTRVYRLSEEDFKLIPYKVNDALIFQSNTGDRDTLVITGQNRYMDAPYELFGSSDSLDCYSLNFMYHNRRPKQPDETIMALNKTRNGNTKIGFGVRTGDSFFYGLRHYEIDEFRKMKTQRLKTRSGDYSDVVVIEPTQENKEFSSRDNFILRLYWSKSRGLVRFDKNKNVYYELID